MDKEELKILQKQVTLFRSEGKYKETIESCYHLLKYGIELNDYKSILTAHINKASSYYSIGEMEEAFNSINAYDEICMEHGDDLDKLNLYNTLFVLYEYNKDFHKSKQTLKKSIELGKKLERYNIVSNGYSNYSHIYINQKNYIDALKMSQLGLEMARLHEPKSEILEIRVKLNMALSYIGLEDFNSSKVLIDEFMKDPIFDKFIREKSHTYTLEGKWYSKQGMYRKAFESLTYAKELVESYNDIYLLKEIEEEMCELCELMGDINLGYKIQKEYISLLNKINTQQLEITALKLDIKHNITAMEKKANTDFLTGLYNRSYLEKTINDWLEEAAIKKENVVCIVFDIDDFKSINDEYGHLLGDKVIKCIGESCSKIVDRGDLIGRYGGDEFIIILRRACIETGMIKAKELGDVLRNLNINKDGEPISIKASIGISDNLNGKVKSFSELFNFSDRGLYKAKENGKNQIYVHSSI